MPTNIPYGSDAAAKLFGVGLFTSCMQRPTTINRLTGPFPKSAEKQLRKQSTNQMPIVKTMDLTKMAGDEITFDLVNPIGGKPIMGSAMAEGRGEDMSLSTDRLRINQMRKPISAGSTMTQQRTPHDLRATARALGQNYADRYLDQLELVHMAGARGSVYDIEWTIPLESDDDFDAIVMNPVKAPSKNRHFISTGDGIESVKVSGGEVTIATTDLMNLDVVDAIRTWVDSVPLPPPPCYFPGDQIATDSPLRVLLVSSQQYTNIAQSPNFRTLQANAYARAAVAGNHPLFRGDVGLWNGILVVKSPKPIRFFAGDDIKICQDATSDTETTVKAPAALGDDYAIDRAILLGGQSLALAFGKSRQTGFPFFWSEKELDHKDKLEVLIGMIGGCSKIRFLIDHGNQTEYTDFGVAVIDTAVKIIS